MSAKEALLPQPWKLPDRELKPAPAKPKHDQPIITPEIERRAVIYDAIFITQGVPDDPKARSVFVHEHRSSLLIFVNRKINKEKQNINVQFDNAPVYQLNTSPQTCYETETTPL